MNEQHFLGRTSGSRTALMTLGKAVLVLQRSMWRKRYTYSTDQAGEGFGQTPEERARQQGVMKGIRRASETLLRANFLQRHGAQSLETAGWLGVEGDWRTEVRAFSLIVCLDAPMSPHQAFSGSSLCDTRTHELVRAQVHVPLQQGTLGV